MSQPKSSGTVSRIRSFAAGYLLEAYVLILAIISLIVWARFDSLLAGGMIAVAGLLLGGILYQKVKGAD